jgi:hypothetical protein
MKQAVMISIAKKDNQTVMEKQNGSIGGVFRLKSRSLQIRGYLGIFMTVLARL